MNVARSAGEVLAEHTTLELECIDRMYLNVYVPLAAGGRRGGLVLPQGAGQSGAVVGVDGADDEPLRRGSEALRGRPRH